MFNRLLPVLALVVVSPAALAASFSYDYLELGFGEVHPDGDGLYAGGALSLDKRFGVQGSLGILDYKGGDGSVVRVGGFLHKPLHRSLDLFATGELVATDFDYVRKSGARASDTDWGLALSGGIRYELQDNVHFETKVLVTEVEPYDDGIGLSVGGRFLLDRTFSVAAGIASDTEYDGLWLNLRMNL